MNISFDLYRVFYYVCKNKSITKAANELNVSQPAVTKHIKNLEGLLGLTLISKSSKGINLTDEGKRLYEEVKSHVEALNDLEKAIMLKQDNYEYTIKIIANYSVVRGSLLDAIDLFSKKHPNITFELNTYRYDIAFSKLRDAECDLVILNYKEEMNDYFDIQVNDFKSISDIFIVKKEDRDKYPDVLSLKDICDYPLICKENNAVSTSNLISYLSKEGVGFNPKYVINTDWLIEEYVKRGLGIGIVPEESVKNELGVTIEKINTDVDLPPRKMCYAIRKNSVYYSVLQEFIHELKKII